MIFPSFLEKKDKTREALEITAVIYKRQSAIGLGSHRVGDLCLCQLCAIGHFCRGKSYKTRKTKLENHHVFHSRYIFKWLFFQCHVSFRGVYMYKLAPQCLKKPASGCHGVLQSLDKKPSPLKNISQHGKRKINFKSAFKWGDRGIWFPGSNHLTIDSKGRGYFRETKRLCISDVGHTWNVGHLRHQRKILRQKIHPRKPMAETPWNKWDLEDEFPFCSEVSPRFLQRWLPKKNRKKCTEHLR